jgi:hypothetical protein
VEWKGPAGAVGNRGARSGASRQLTGPEVDDRDALDHAVEVLTSALEELLHEVGARAIPPEAYHVM